MFVYFDVQIPCQESFQHLLPRGSKLKPEIKESVSCASGIHRILLHNQGCRHEPFSQIPGSFGYIRDQKLPRDRGDFNKSILSIVI